MCNLYAEDRVRVASVQHSSWYVGVVLILLFVLVAFEAGIGWRTLFAVFAGMVLLYSPAAIFRFLPGPISERTPRAVARVSSQEIARDGTFRLIAIGLFFCVITEVTMASWLPYYLEVGVGAVVACTAQWD